MWYEMQADEKANLIVGFQKDVTKEEYLDHLNNKSLLDILNVDEVQKGDVYFIPTGRVHAIGAGVMLAEIQQTSDITYRVFDFNRKDKEGNLRELHTELALDAIDFDKKDDFKVAYSKDLNAVNEMVTCPYFITNYLSLTEDHVQDVSLRDSFTIFLCTSGNAVISNDWGEASIKNGETVLLPAASNSIHIHTTKAELLEVTI